MDIVPIHMVNLSHYILEVEDIQLLGEMVSITDPSSSEDDKYSYEQDESGYTLDEITGWGDDEIVLEWELQKVRMLLCSREEIELNATFHDLAAERKKQREKWKQK